MLCAFVFYKISKKFKSPKVNCVSLVTGGVKTGKSTFAVYLAISNLIINCLETLDGMEKLPPEQYSQEDFEMTQSILEQAMAIEEKYRTEIEEMPSTIQRPNWENL